MEHPDKMKVVARISKPDAAMAQLMSAVTLWFQGGDIVSIHTLAAAAQDCFYRIAEHRKGRTPRKFLESQSKGTQKRIADAQNFFKHGHKWLTKEVLYPVINVEFLMFDSIVCYGMVFDPLTMPATLRLFAVRFYLENWDILGPAGPNRDLTHFLPADVIEELRPLSRYKFFECGLGLVGEKFPPIKGGPFHSTDPS